ncbi:unnamed protein product [Adineta steineri]|uniref:RRM domain-containing protein n=1 Tax=Adineta steineri TaxID=433720 RepID=A0A815RJ42_9BILA|nr:unnamed protein product [Adineta steineri]CAF1478093.1 unnamed protein product [Adineta steineri]
MEGVQPTATKHHQLSSTLVVSPVQNCSLIQDEEDNSEGQIHSHRNNKLHNTTNEDSFLTTLAEAEFDKYLTELSQIFEEQSSQTDILMEISSMFSDIETDNEQFCSVEDLINTGDQISSAISSTLTQNEELTNSVNEYQEGSLMTTPRITTDTITTEISIKNNLKNRKADLIKNGEKTLIVSGLRNDINQTDLFNYFAGSIQVILKQCQTSPFKYAFILHGTIEEAKCNLSRSIDYIRLGSKCRIKSVDYSSSLPVDDQSYDKQTIAVTKIPENVSEDDLHRLFPSCRISKYCPPRTVRRKTVSTESSGKTKTLWG